MRGYSRVLLSGVLLMMVAIPAMAQRDVCLPVLPAQYSDAGRIERMKIEASERAARETREYGWDVKMFSVKNMIPDDHLQALCIFRIEVVPQPALKMVQIKAPKELMGAIEDALKRLDVPPPPSVEITSYVLVVSDVEDPRLMPVPKELQNVVNQLKSVLPKGVVQVADTIVNRGTDGKSLGVNVGTSASNIVSLEALVHIRETPMPVVRLDNLKVKARDATFDTSLDVPVGTQVVVGRGTSVNAKGNGAVVLVISAKLFN